MAVDRPLLPAMVEDNRHDGDDLHHHLEFAEFTGFDGEAFGGGDGTQATDQKLATDDDDRDPRRNQAGIELHQRDERGGDEKLVGQGIEQNSHGGDLSAFAGEVAVNTVGHGGGDEDGGGQQFFFAGHAAEAAAAKNPHQQRNAEDADQRDGVGQVHTTRRFWWPAKVQF